MEYGSYNKETTTNYEYTAEQRLCAAVILQAIKDVHYSDRKKAIFGGKLPTRADTEARQWILSNSKAPFSFLWCLEHIFNEVWDTIDIKEVRRIILSKPCISNSVTLHHVGSGRRPVYLCID